MAWIGTLGNLVEFKCPATLRRTSEVTTTTRTTLGGVDKMFTEPVGPARVWDVGVAAATPDDLSVLQLLTMGAYGAGPFWFVDPWSETTNVMSPRASLPGAGNAFAYSASTGTASAASIPGLGSVPSVNAAGGAYLWFGYGTPLIVGKPVTVSVWARNVTEIQAAFLDSTGATVNAATKAITTSGDWTRVHVTGTPATGTREVRIRMTGPTAYSAALPAVTWTPHLTPYIPGQGAPRVAVEGAGVDIVRASQSQQLAAQAVTLRELRSANA